MATNVDDMPLEDLTSPRSPGDMENEQEYNPQEEEVKGKQPVGNGKSMSKAAQQTGIDNKNIVNCKVFLPDGETVSVDLDRKVKAGDLIERIHSDADIFEKDYFSVFFIENSQKIFLDIHKPVKDQVPSTMKNEWRFKYGVKFYLSDPSMLKEDISRYNFCLQLCQDIKDNRVLTDRETAIRLTALMLQASLGDYDESKHAPGYTDEFKEFILLPKEEQPDDYEELIIEVHKAKVGYTPTQAESEFLQIGKKLPRYGMHLFAVKDQTGGVLLVGISYRGISIFNDHIEVSKYPWPNINKIAYKRNKFIIRYRPSDSMADAQSTDSGAMGSKTSGDIRIIKFYTGNPPQSKRIWKCAVEQHTFFRLQVPDRPSRIQQVFRRGTKFRYSGRTFRQLQEAEDERQEPALVRTQSLRLQSSSKKFDYVPARNSFRATKPTIVREFEPRKQDNGSIGWHMLDAPPDIEPQDKNMNNFEEQSVQVKFRLKDALPETSHKFVILKRDNKYEIERVGAKEDDQANADPAFHLHHINPKSTNATTRVSVQLDQKPIFVGKKRAHSIPIYDSTQIPDVKLSRGDPTKSSYEDITSSQTLHSGVTTPHTVGAHKQQFPEEGGPLQFHAPTDEQDQAKQVHQFLRREEALMKNALQQDDKEASGALEEITLGAD